VEVDCSLEMSLIAYQCSFPFQYACFLPTHEYGLDIRL